MWQPLFEPHEAEPLIAAALDIGAELLGATRLGEAAAADPSLTTGAGGIALFLAYLAAYDPTGNFDEGALAHLEGSLTAVSELDLPPSLFAGFSGIGWLLTHLEGRLFEQDEDLAAEVDAGLGALLARPAVRFHFELVHGLAGIGTYLGARWPRGEAGKLLRLILDRLEATAERSPAGITWFSPPELLSERQLAECPRGLYNLGVAHGVPGILGFLAQAKLRGFDDPRLTELAEGTVAWLATQALDDQGHSVFPAITAEGQAARPTRTAWCYGDPGIAAVLLAAGRAFGRAEWEREAIDLACRAASRPLATTGVLDAGLCHGAAGLGHLFNRMYQATGAAPLAAAARTWFEGALALRRPSEGCGGFLAWDGDRPGAEPWTADPGLLGGAAGVGLALLAAATAVEPSWDEVLLLAIPPRHDNDRSGGAP